MRVGDLARSGVVRGDARDGQQPQVLRARSRARRSAATQAPSASQPTDRQTPSHGLIRLPAAAAETVRGVFGGRPRPRFGAAPPAELADDEVLQPVVDLDVDEPAAVRRRQRRGPDAAAGLAVLALAGGQHDPVVAVGGQPDDLEPAVGVGHVTGAIRRAASGHRHRRSARRRRPASRRSRRRRARSATVSPTSGPRWAMTAIRRAVGRPLEVVDVDAGLGQDGRAGRLRLAWPGRPRRGTGASIEPDLRPAAAARQEGEPVAVGRPARGAAAARLADHAGQPRAVGLDDPDLVVADEGEPAAVGRPLRIGDGLLRGGQLGRVAAAERQREELAGAGRPRPCRRRRGRADGGGTRAGRRPRRSPRPSGSGMGWSGRSASGRVRLAAAELGRPRLDDREMVEVVAVEGRVDPVPRLVLADRLRGQVVGEGEEAACAPRSGGRRSRRAAATPTARGGAR